jgi:hypothetical protein
MQLPFTTHEALQLQDSSTRLLYESDKNIEQVIALIFGIPPTDVPHWPGLRAYFRLVHQAKASPVASTGTKATINCAKSADFIPDPFGDYKRSLSFLAEICKALRSTPTNKTPTIDGTIKSWCSTKGDEFNLQLSDDDWLTKHRFAFFQSLAVLTLLFDVNPHESGDQIHISLPDEGMLPVIMDLPLFTSSSRPIVNVIKGFSLLRLPDYSASRPLAYIREEGPRHADATTIRASSISFAMLDQFGNIKIEWTHLISYHLYFVPGTKTLYVFRLPTVCAISCLGFYSSGCIFDV